MQAHNITRGPWGITSLLTTPIYLFNNLSSYGNRRDMASPKPYDETFDRVIGPGEPVFSRIPVRLVTALVIIVGYSVISDSQVETLNWEAGVRHCLLRRHTGLSPCSEPHNGRILATPTTPSACPVETDFYVELTYGVACFAFSRIATPGRLYRPW
jgi:hypothetical protein